MALKRGSGYQPSNKKIDDRKPLILEHLQQNPKATNVEIGRLLGVSATRAGQIMRRLGLSGRRSCG